MFVFDFIMGKKKEGEGIIEVIFKIIIGWEDFFKFGKVFLVGF